MVFEQAKKRYENEISVQKWKDFLEEHKEKLERYIMSAVVEFNKRNRAKLMEIVEELLDKKSVEKVDYYHLDFTKPEGKEVVGPEKIGKDTVGEVLNRPVSERIEYYWITFTYNKTDYKVSMFYKDFDHDSGNLHVLPGRVQWWKKEENISKVFPKLIGNEVFVSAKERIKAITEGVNKMGWVPQKKPPVFWTNNNILNYNLDFDKTVIYDKVFPKPWHPNIKTKYSILGFAKNIKESPARFFAYRVIEVSNYGYFYDFDNAWHCYKKGIKQWKNGTSESSASPNDYSETEGRWLLNYKNNLQICTNCNDDIKISKESPCNQEK